MSQGFVRSAMAGLCAGTALFMSAGATAETVRVMCSSSGIELELCRDQVAAFEAATGHEIEIVAAPQEWSDMLPLLQQTFAAQSGEIDVFPVDVIWIGALANHLLPLSQHLTEQEIGDYMPSLVATGSPQGELLALPWYTDTGFLFYRSDLLEQYQQDVPQTWAELTETAQIVQEGERAAGNADFWGYTWQGKSYEGLVCNVAEWFGSAGGGFVSGDGEIVAASEANRTMLEMAAGWVGSISPEGVLSYSEDDSRAPFQAGNALFHRNWSYVLTLADEEGSAIAGRVGVAPLPRGGADGAHVGVNGSAYLGVNRYSESPDVAVQLATYLTSAESQAFLLIEGGYMPTRPGLYGDEEVLARAPNLDLFLPAFDNVVARPSDHVGSDYPRVSHAIQEAIHGAISGRSDPAAALAGLQTDLERLAERGGW